jgi:hypothetical protein
VLLDGGGNPRMRELQQQRAPRAQENCGLPIYLPRDRLRAEHTREGIGRGKAHCDQLAFQIFRVDDFKLSMRCRQSPVSGRGSRPRQSR